jgi:hypothetical protein
MRLSAISIVVLAALLAAACGSSGNGKRKEPGERPPRREPAPPVDPATRHLDDDCLVQARTIRVVLPEGLRKECEVEALVGGWAGKTWTGRGEASVTVRRLRLLGDEIVVTVAPGPIANLRVIAEGRARISTPILERLEPPADVILLRPDAVTIQ